MFEKSFLATITAIRPRRKANGEDDSSVHLDVMLEMPMDDDHLRELGVDVLALVEARRKADNKLLPWKTVVLQHSYEDLRMVAYRAGGDDIRFDIGGCAAKALRLVREKDDGTKCRLRWRVVTPPMKQADWAFLIDNVNAEMRFAIYEAQLDLPAV